MRAVVQRVAWAKVEVDGATVGAIERGLLVYLGVGKCDGDAERDRPAGREFRRAAPADWVLGKIVGLRIFEDDAGKMNLAVGDVGGKLLVVSQFTLYGDVRHGRRPGFDDAMAPVEAERVYEDFVARARAAVPVETGRFGASMHVTSLNDGPVTIWIDSEKRG